MTKVNEMPEIVHITDREAALMRENKRLLQAVQEQAEQIEALKAQPVQADPNYISIEHVQGFPDKLDNGPQPVLYSDCISGCMVRRDDVWLALTSHLKPKVKHCMCPACRGGDIHDSDCSVHNMPDHPNGPCDCKLAQPAPLTDALQAILDLSAGWDEHGSTGPKVPWSWESVGRMAMDYARAALRTGGAG